MLSTRYPLIDAPEARLWAACAKAEAAVFARNSLLAVLAHDLRGSLNNIHSWTHVLDVKFGATQVGMQSALGGAFNGIRSGIHQQTLLIENSIEAVLAETKSVPLIREPVLLKAWLESVIANHRAIFAAQRQVIIDADVQIADQPLSADAQRIWQALWVILAYAIDVSLPNACVTVQASIEQDTCVVLVSFEFSVDALLDQTATHIFEHFVRASIANADAPNTKLALSLPTQVVAAHAGQFEQQCAADGTTVLSVKLPLIEHRC